MTRQNLDIVTEDGTARATLVLPDTPNAARSGIIMYMDGIGFRPVLDAMAERYAAEGYTVLLPDLF